MLDRREDQGWVYVQCVANKKKKRENKAKLSASTADTVATAQQHSIKGKRGLIPTTHLQALMATFDWEAQAPDELTFETGDKFIVLGRGEDKGWLFAELLPTADDNVMYQCPFLDLKYKYCIDLAVYYQNFGCLLSKGRDFKRGARGGVGLQPSPPRTLATFSGIFQHFYCREIFDRLYCRRQRLKETAPICAALYPQPTSCPSGLSTMTTTTRKRKRKRRIPTLLRLMYPPLRVIAVCSAACLQLRNSSWKEMMDVRAM